MPDNETREVPRQEFRIPIRTSYTGLFLETCGVEMEGVGPSTHDISRLLSNCGASNEATVTRDASVEAAVSLTSSMRLNYYSYASQFIRRIDSITAGYEVVTYPLPLDVMDSTVHRITDALKASNNHFISPRASIHIHIGFAKNMALLKKSLLMGLAIDPLLFAMAGMGEQYRGAINQSIYARPLEGGVGVATGDGYSHLLPERSLSTRSVNEFFLNYFIFGRTQRYHPARYFAVNLYSILLHGTLEFRHFNQTDNPFWIMAAVRLVHAISELIVFASEDELIELRTVSVFDMSPSNINELLYGLLSLFKKHDIDIDPSVVNNIQDILDVTPIPVFSKSPPLTHSTATFGREGWMVRLAEDPVNSGHIDIHNINNISITDERY